MVSKPRLTSGSGERLTGRDVVGDGTASSPSADNESGGGDTGTTQSEASVTSSPNAGDVRVDIASRTGGGSKPTQDRDQSGSGGDQAEGGKSRGRTEPATAPAVSGGPNPGDVRVDRSENPSGQRSATSRPTGETQSTRQSERDRDGQTRSNSDTRDRRSTADNRDLRTDLSQRSTVPQSGRSRRESGPKTDSASDTETKTREPSRAQPRAAAGAAAQARPPERTSQPKQTEIEQYFEEQGITRDQAEGIQREIEDPTLRIDEGEVEPMMAVRDAVAEGETSPTEAGFRDISSPGGTKVVAVEIAGEGPVTEADQRRIQEFEQRNEGPVLDEQTRNRQEPIEPESAAEARALAEAKAAESVDSIERGDVRVIQTEDGITASVAADEVRREQITELVDDDERLATPPTVDEADDIRVTDRGRVELTPEGRSEVVAEQTPGVAADEVRVGDDGDVQLTPQGKVGLAAARSEQYSAEELAYRDGEVVLSQAERREQRLARQALSGASPISLDQKTAGVRTVSRSRRSQFAQQFERKLAERDIPANIDAEDVWAFRADGEIVARLDPDVQDAVARTALVREVEDEVGADVPPGGLNIEQTASGSYRASLTEKGREAVEVQNAPLADVPIVGDISRGGTQIRQGIRDVTDPVAERFESITPSKSDVYGAVGAAGPVAAAEPTIGGEIVLGTAVAGATGGAIAMEYGGALTGDAPTERATVQPPSTISVEARSELEPTEQPQDRSELDPGRPVQESTELEVTQPAVGTEIDTPAEDSFGQREVALPSGSVFSEEVGIPEGGQPGGGGQPASPSDTVVPGNYPLPGRDVPANRRRDFVRDNSPDAVLGTSPVNEGVVQQPREEQTTRPQQRDRLTEEQPARREITRDDIESDLPTPREVPPSNRERMVREDLRPYRRRFPTGEQAVVDREMTRSSEEAEELLEESQKRFQEAEPGVSPGQVISPIARERQTTEPSARLRPFDEQLQGTSPLVDNRQEFRTAPEAQPREIQDVQQLNIQEQTPVEVAQPVGFDPYNTTENTPAYPPEYPLETTNITATPRTPRRPRVPQPPDNDEELRPLGVPLDTTQFQNPIATPGDFLL